MAQRFILRAALLFALTLFAIATRPTASTAQEKAKPKTQSPTEKIEAALDRKISVDFVETPLSEAVDYLNEETGINIVLDTEELEAVGAGSDTTVTKILGVVRFASLLNYMLKEHDLAWTIRDETLTITSVDAAASNMTTRVYRLDGLLPEKRKTEKKNYYQPDELHELVDAIIYLVAPDSWEDTGGLGTISVFRNKLVIRNTIQVHRRISGLLGAIRKARAIVRSGDKPPTVLPVQSKENLAILKKLREQKAEFDFVETPLAEIVLLLEEKHNIPILMDIQELEALGLGTDKELTASLKDISLPAALNHLLRPHELTWLVHDDVLLITSTDFAETELSNAVYPVADLLRPALQPAKTNKEATKQSQASVADFSAESDELIDLITGNVAPESWDEAGGLGSIEYLPLAGALVVSQQPRLQSQIERLLADLRNVQQQHKQNRQASAIHWLNDSNARRKLQQALNEKTSMEFVDTPLSEIADYLSDLHKVPIRLDTNNLETVGAGGDTPLTHRIEGVTLNSGLKLLLRGNALKHTIRDQILLITSADDADNNTETRIYVAGDLMPKDADPEAVTAALGELQEVFVASVDPDSWEDAGGIGAVQTWTPAAALVVSQTLENHYRIEQLLEKLRSASEMEPAAKK